MDRLHPKMGSRRWLLAAAHFLLLLAPAASDDTYDDKLTIEPNMQEITLQYQKNYTLFCNGKTQVFFKQQETDEENHSNYTTATRVVDSEIPEYPYRIAFDLISVNEFTVGYFACYDETFTETDVLSNIMEEPQDTPHIKFIYVFVNGTKRLLAPMKTTLTAKENSIITIGCRPTSPDIKVELVESIDKVEKKTSFKFNPKFGFELMKQKNMYICVAEKKDHITKKPYRVYVNVKSSGDNAKPTIISEPSSEYAFIGEKFTLNCTVNKKSDQAYSLEWFTPHKVLPTRFNITTNQNSRITNGNLYRTLTVYQAQPEDSGVYTCSSKTMANETNTTQNKIIIDSSGSFLTLKSPQRERIRTYHSRSSYLKWTIDFDGYPHPKFTIYKEDKLLPISNKYETKEYKSVVNKTDYMVFTVNHVTVHDTGKYTVYATNGYRNDSLVLTGLVEDEPKVSFGAYTDVRRTMGSQLSMVCDVTGYPLPIVTWHFIPECLVPDSDCAKQEIQSTDEVISLAKLTSEIKIEVQESGNVTCSASNKFGSNKTELRPIIVYEMPDGFGIKKKSTWFAKHDKMSLLCVASKYDYANITWMWEDAPIANHSGVSVVYFHNTLSLNAHLIVDNIELSQGGQYTCNGIKFDTNFESETVNITVDDLQLPVITEPESTFNEKEYYPLHEIELSCEVHGVPRPSIVWLKDDNVIIDTNNTRINNTVVNESVQQSVLKILKSSEEDQGNYACTVANSDAKKFYNIVINGKSKNKSIYLGIMGVIVVACLFIVVYLLWRIRKEKILRKELAAAGLLYFREGNTGSLNPELGIDDQAELLPYDEKFEFPQEKLTFGHQLGAGAFGVVFKAEARGISDAEDSTTVAVKMVKKNADNMYIKALASELKIMVHLGKHVNVVNLLGACTKNVGKRELQVIVEFCKFGNIHNYMIKHRDVFIDQFDQETGEKNVGRVNRAFSYNSANSGHTQSDYFGSGNTQMTGNTLLHTGNSSKSAIRKGSESEYVQPEWRSNYTNDDSYSGRTMRPLCSRDLLCWAFQIARGMEYLASRKVLHGDLAARNVLLTTDNVVKICDFGLAKSIYNTDNYQKKGNSPLPVKWLAIECMTDQIFSTQSDVWSFGVVLWELFSLARTPYPNMNGKDLLDWLNSGNRMPRPQFANIRLHEMMLTCWEAKPAMRPSFTALQEQLGSFLEESVRAHYLDLNSPYIDMNSKWAEERGKNDYLDMLTAPDYRNMVTPSVQDYANSPFFPPDPSLQHTDEQGYLQMSPGANKVIFSPRAWNDEVFHFENKKYLPKPSLEATSSNGTELTPMLTLNNLPARNGSDSDHEVAPDRSYVPMNRSPVTVVEEVDSVFEADNKTNADINNYKNTMVNGAVTNPSYITLQRDFDKKPTENSYVNMRNGLVK